MTFIYELYPYSLEIHPMYVLPMSRLSKVIVWQTDIQTDRHDGNYIPRRFAGGQRAASFASSPKAIQMRDSWEQINTGIVFVSYSRPGESGSPCCI